MFTELVEAIRLEARTKAQQARGLMAQVPGARRRGQTGAEHTMSMRHVRRVGGSATREGPKKEPSAWSGAFSLKHRFKAKKMGVQPSQLAAHVEAIRTGTKKSEKLYRLFRSHSDPFYHQGSRKAAQGDAAVAKDRKHPDRKYYDDVVRDARRERK